MTGEAGALPGAAAWVEPEAGHLAEMASVPWRVRTTSESLARREWRWTAWTLAVTTPFFAVAGLLVLLEPMLVVVSLWSIAHGVAIPALYARRGARSVVPLGSARSSAGSAEPRAERVALGLLGDLVGDEARELVARTGLLMERGELGTWLIGERGAMLVRSRGRRTDCWCVRIGDASELPSADRLSHLLLALREDEAGFATVANMDFSGASWRIRRRMEKRSRPALDLARAAARNTGESSEPAAIPRRDPLRPDGAPGPGSRPGSASA